MNILHVCSNYFPAKGGPQYTMKHLSEKLIAYYHDNVEVITTDSYYGPDSMLYKKIRPSYECIEHVLVNRYSFRRWHLPLIKYGNKAKAKITGSGFSHNIIKKRTGPVSHHLIKALSTTEAEVIMATTAIYTFCDYPLWRYKTKNPKPFVLYGAIHLHKELSANDPLLERAKTCDCYIANTDFEKKKLVEHGVHSEKIITIGTGISAEEFNCNDGDIQNFKKQIGITENDIVVGFVGKLSVGKGVTVLIEAIRKISVFNKQVKLLLAGIATEDISIIKSARDKELLPVILIENFEEKTKPLIYHSLDIFVLASRSESFGVVFLEAWACQKPVIGTYMGATASLIKEGEDGLLFDLSNNDNLVEKILLLVNNAPLRQMLAENGYQKMQQYFTWPKIVAKYREAYLTGIENFKRLQNNYN